MSKPHSPFRYPGGKKRLASRVMELLEEQLLQWGDSPNRYVEPFVGGGAVALEVAQRYPEIRLLLNDADPRVAAMWQVVSDAELYPVLKAMVEKTTPTVALWRREKEKGVEPDEPVALAFRALLLNRCTFSGSMSIKAGGPIGGYDQTGEWKIDARWKHELLIPNLDLVHELLVGRTEVTTGPWQQVARRSGLHYYDPPYIDASVKTLYGIDFTVDDHIALRNHLRHHDMPWVLSYEDSGSAAEWMYDFAICEKLDHQTRFQRKGPDKRVEMLFSPKSARPSTTAL